MQRIWHMITAMIPVTVGALGTVKGMVKTSRKYQGEILCQKFKRSAC